MKGLILAGGRGTRLAPHTDDRPKALVEVLGRTLLDRQIAGLLAAGADEIGAIVSWKAERFDALDLRTFMDHDQTGTMVDALRSADRWFREDPCLVAYGDIAFTPDDARRLAETRADVAIAYDPNWLPAWTERFGDPLIDAERFLHRDGWLVEAGGRADSLAVADGQYIGLLRTTPEGWAALMGLAARALADGAPVIDVTDLMTRAVRSGQDVAVVAIDGPWWEVDNPKDLLLGVPRFEEIDRILFRR